MIFANHKIEENYANIYKRFIVQVHIDFQFVMVVEILI